MRICLICSEYPPVRHGGIGTMTRDLAEGLVKKGFDVTVIGVYPSLVEVKAGRALDSLNDVLVLRLASTGQKLPPQLRILLDRLRLSLLVREEHAKRSFDLIECPDYGGDLALGGPRSVPLVCRSHGSQLYFDRELNTRRGSRIIYFLEKKTITRADHLIFVSHYVAVKTIDWFSLKSVKYDVIYNAVDTELFSPLASASCETAPIIFVGSLRPKKGIEEFLQALNMVFADFPQAEAQVLGSTDDASYMDKLRSIVRVQWRDRVRFTGYVPRSQVLASLRQASVCVYPSKSEAFAIAPLEAMSVGKPIVITNRASGPETVEHGVSGLLCDPDSPQDIAEKISFLLRNEAIAREIGKNARHRVLERFDRRKWLEQNISLYESVVLTSRVSCRSKT